MQALLKKQTEVLSRLEDHAKQDKIIQAEHLFVTKRIDDDGERFEDQLKELNKNLNEKSGDGLNSNVIKLFKEMEKVGKTLSSRALSDEEAVRITGDVSDRRQFETIKPRMDDFKEGFKDFFTMRGFLDKTGIVSRGSGGIVSEYLDRGEERNKYADSRLKMDQGNTNMEAGRLAKAAGVDYKTLSEEDKSIYQDQAKQKLKSTYKEQFNKQQEVQFEISKNEKALEGFKQQGFNEAQIQRTPEFQRRTELAAEMAKVDTRVRPEGFDSRTGKIKEKSESATEQEVNARGDAKIVPFTDRSSNALSAASDEEAMLEQNRMVAEQTGLLIKIEENTRELKDGLSGEGGNQKPAVAAAEAGGGFGVGSMLGGAGKIGKIASSAGRGLMTGAKTAGNFLMKRAGPLAAIGAVGAGAYAGFQGFSAAGDKQEAAKEEIKAKVESGEITQGEAAQLTKNVDETATVEKGGAIGKGGGMAAGGAVGALKGAALGAAVGSVVPIVGTVIGGAIGAGLGAVGGSFLGGKAGEFIGEKAGKVKNFTSGLLDSAKSMFGSGLSGKEAAQNMEIEVVKRMEAEGVEDGTPRANEIREEVRAEIIQKDPNAFVQSDQFIKSETDLEKRSGGDIESSKMTKGISAKKSILGSTTLGALFTKKGLKTGQFLGTSSSSEDGSESINQISGRRIAGGLFRSDTYKVSGSDGDEIDVSKAQFTKIEELATSGKSDEADKLISLIKETKNAQASEKTETGSPIVSPPPAPQTGNMVSKQSGDNEQAKLDASKGNGSSSIVAAPTINNTNNVQNNPVKLAPRNGDSTINKYMQSRYSY